MFIILHAQTWDDQESIGPSLINAPIDLSTFQDGPGSVIAPRVYSDILTSSSCKSYEMLSD